MTRRDRIYRLVANGMLAAVAYVVMLLSKSLPQINGFLQLDMKDTIICIGGFIFGPMSAAAISIVVALIEMFSVSDTGPIGCLMNVLATVSFCCTASYIYAKKHTRKGAVLSLSCGVVALVVVMLLWNYLVTPVYQGIPRAEVAKLLPTVFLPFNLVKGGLNMAAILLLYKPIVTALRKAGLAPASRSYDPENPQPRKVFSPGFLLFSLALLVTFVTWALVLMKKI